MKTRDFHPIGTAVRCGDWQIAQENKATGRGREQRKGALKISSACRTVSETAVLIVAGVILIHLLVIKRYGGLELGKNERR